MRRFSRPRSAAALLATCLLSLPFSLAAQDTTATGGTPLPITVRLGGDTLALRRPPILGPFGAAAPYRPSPRFVAESAVRRARRERDLRVALGWSRLLATALPAPAATVAAVPDSLPPAAPPDTLPRAVRTDSGPPPGTLVPLARPDARGDARADGRNPITGDLFGDLADLGINLDARLESKFQRLQNLSCTASQVTFVYNNCNGGWQPPGFDFQFNVRTGGVVAERVHVNVDYDTQREFDASNNISVFYQGKTDEILQKLEVGNVSLQPPPSRFLTSGIPSGNYGIQATGQLGPMRYAGIVAQQKGNVKKDNVFTVGERSQSTIENVRQDFDFEQRRFFFTVDPRGLRGFPNIDLLNRQQMRDLAVSLPDSVRPARVYIYRQYIGATNQNPRGPQFSVRGARNPVRQTYELLRENVDYYLDPSLLWIALVRPLDRNNERLAVAYEVTVNGVTGRNVGTGGTPDIEFTEAPQVANLLWEPEVQPDNPAYFLREIKSAYRVGGSDMQRTSLSVKLVTGTSGDQEKPIDPSRGETYLQMYGLSQATNPTQFDLENRLWPRPNDPNFAAGATGQQKLIPDYFVMFPSVQPFSRAGLAQPLANPSNDTLYRYPNEYVYSTQRPQAIYRLLTRYLSEGGAGETGIQLPTILLRPNSERVVLDGNILRKDVDYEVDYDIGRITFLRPDTLFAQPRQVNVSYEENPGGFVTAPTTILGFVSQFPLQNGQFSFTAISQNQRSALTRPPLGFEPIGSLVAGVTGSFAWDADLLSRAVGRVLPFGRAATLPRSRVAVQGELAMSRPQANAAGLAYVESFEGDAGISVNLSEAAWYYSSRPTRGSVLGLTGPDPFLLERSTTLAYQNNGFDSAGNLVQYRIDQIDPQVLLVGGGVQPAEQVLFMTLYPLRTGGLFNFDPGTGRSAFKWTIGDNTLAGQTPTGRRWRSLRTVLNPSGTDLSRIENVEFFVQIRTQDGRRERNPTLVIDFGELSENSVTFAPETLVVAPPGAAGAAPDSTYRGKRFTGLNRFDSERDPFSRTFNALENDRGIGGDVADTVTVVDGTGGTPVSRVANGVRLCSAIAQTVQTLGDTRANCTVANNRLDEEDIDLDGRLNGSDEQLRRFIVDLSDKRTWTRVGRCAEQLDSIGAAPDSVCWVQVRLNWRAPAEELNNPNERRVRAMRVTMVSSPAARDEEFSRIALARFRLVGAPWLKRTARPASGIAGDSMATMSGYVVASVVGTLDSSAVLPYTPPPGVVEQAESQQTNLGNTRLQVNERALRIQAGIPGQQFRAFDRAEAFFRFAEGTKSFMGYRTLRMWMRGRGNGWGPGGELNGFIRIGRDENNFYLYRTEVDEGPTQDAWNPEVRVDLQRFQILRARLENNFLTGSADSLACSGTDLELLKRSGLPRGVLVRRYAVCEDGYIVYSADPAVTPPNLAGVQELAVGIVRVDSLPRGGRALMPNDTLELWVNDIRLSDVVNDMGFAGELALSGNAADLADFRVNISRRDPNFRQLGETPSFLTSNGVNVGTTLHLERFLPARFGVVIPFNIDYAGAGIEQLFINRTDVRADGIAGLRNPKDSRVNYSFAVRRAQPITRGWYRGLVNGLTLNGSWGRSATQTAFQEGANNTYAFNAGLDLTSETRESGLPRVLDWVVGLLPRGLRESEAIQQFRATQFRWRPSQLRLSSGLARVANTTTSFTKAAEAASDTGQTIFGLSHLWQNSAVLGFAPTPSLRATMEARQLLDLRDYRDYRDGAPLADSTDRGEAAAAERLELLGASLGLERDRSLLTAVSFTPALALWLRPELSFTSNFTLNKDPNARALLRENDSTGAFRLPQRLGASQSLTAGTDFDFGRLLRSRFGERTAVGRFGRLIGPANIRWTQGLTSNYDNTAFGPSLAYQFGIGGVDDFRGLDTRLATSAGRVKRLTTTGSLILPLAITLTGRFEDGSSETWTRRSLDGFQALIASEQRILPDLLVRWNFRPARLSKLVSNVNLNAGYRKAENLTVIPNETGGLADRSSTRAENIGPFSGAITWAWLGGLTTDFTQSRELRVDERPGSITDNETERITFGVGRPFTLPKKWNARGKLITRLSYQSDATFSTVGGTRQLIGEVAEDPVVSVLTNNGRQAFNVNASTDLTELLSFSLTGSHVLTFDRNYNRRTANTLFSTVLTLRFFAGDIR